MDKVIDNYELESSEPIDESGVFSYYKAMDMKENRTVLLGVLKDEYANDGDMVRKFREYYLNLFQKVKKAPNLAEVFNIVGDTGHTVYTVQEYVEGKNLSEYFQDNPVLTGEEFKPIFKQICEGLYNLHKRDICHYSVQPKNILIGSDNRVKITGSGNLYLALGDQNLIERLVQDSKEYIAPEIIKGEDKDRITKTCDIYSLGKLIQSLPFPIDNLLLQMTLEVNPNDRFQSSRELGEKIDQLFIKQSQVMPEATPDSTQPEAPAAGEVIRLADEKVKPNPPIPFRYKLPGIPANAEVKVISKLPEYSLFNKQTHEFNWKPGPEHKGKHLVRFEVTSDSGKKIYELPIEVKFGIGLKPTDKKEIPPAPEPKAKPKTSPQPKPPAKEKPETAPQPKPNQMRPTKPAAAADGLNFKKIVKAFCWKYNLLLFMAAIAGIFLYLPDLVVGLLALVLVEGVFLLTATSSQTFMDKIKDDN